MASSRNPRSGSAGPHGTGGRRTSRAQAPRPTAASRSHAHRVAAVPTDTDSSARIWWAFVAFAVLAFLLCLRLVQLTLVVGPENASIAESARTVDVVLEAKRGTIYDRNGNVLAMSTDAKTVYCNPTEVTDAQAAAASCAEYLGGAPADYLDALTSADTSFAYLKRKADVDAAEALFNQQVPGIYLLDDTKRLYPSGETAGQVVGMCDVDGNGISGLELYYDDILSGEDGEMQMEQGRNGYPIAGGLHQTRAAVNGTDIVVSIDVEMQEYLQTRLAECVADVGGKHGNAMLYDGATGEIVATASTPYLNPGDRSKMEEGASTLMPVSSQYEPGSIFKAVSACAVLEAGVADPATEVFCPVFLEADEYTVSDSHEREAQTMTFAQIISDSSNVGMSLLSERLGFGPLYDKIVEYGLTERTGVDFPGEAEGYSTDESTWSLIRSYNVSFGQGIMVSPLQMCRFYGALTNDGVAETPHFLLQYPQTGDVPDWPEERIIENTSAIAPLTSMLQGVVSEGTGTGAQIEGFAPAGKTGTAQYADETGLYVEDMYHLSFVGYLPGTTSQLVCFVGVTEVPLGGNTASAFKDIMTFAINHYKITPKG